MKSRVGRLRRASMVVVALVGVAAFGQSAKQAPTIEITTVPRYDAQGGRDKMGTIGGVVRGECQNCRVVLFARTNTWYVQPYDDSPFTSIARGEWRNETHLGQEYAAVLVRASYQPPKVTRALPSVGGEVLAVDTKPGAAR